ncbi:MAG: hypothetical protein HC892_18710 [Saprospiraceae bacterium]|nr:hypothetical protein [Saprospiraceae bacterium]
MDGLEEAKTTLPWYLTKNKYGGKPVLTLGIPEFPLMSKLDYEIFHNSLAPLVFVNNAIASVYNGTSESWNEARVGRTMTSMMIESESQITDFVNNAGLSDYQKLATNVETYENIVGAVFSIWLTKKIKAQL